jgi:ABC-type glycerol-3-phosphate transport system substrate-binding protein
MSDDLEVECVDFTPHVKIVYLRICKKSRRILMNKGNLSRRHFLRLSALAAAGTVLGACAPAEPEVIREEVVVKETVMVEGEAVEVTTVVTATPEEPAEAPSEPETVTIRTLWCPGGIDTYMREIIEMYKEDKPNVEFEMTVIEQEQKRATEVTIMTNEGAPDFAWINYGSGLTDRLADAGAIVPLNEYYDKYGWWDFLPDHLHTHEYQGQMYHFSVASVFTPMMWYNKALMDQVGFEPPTTMDELYAWAEACNGNDLEALAMGDRDGWPGFHMYQCISSRTTPLEDYEKILNFDEEEYYMADYPGFEEAFQIMRDMQVEGVWSRGVLDMNDSEARELLLNGKAVAYETGIWATGQLREGLGDDLGFFLFPQVKDDIPIPLTASYADEFMLSAYSEVKDEVAEFFDFVLSKDAQKVIAKLGTLPIRTDFTAGDLEGFADPLAADVALMFGSGDYPVTDEIVTFWPAELYAMLRNNVQAVIGGQKTPAEIVQEFDELAAKFRAGEA